ncbi:MAG: aspartate aminotransferase family protein [Ignavibacteriales bacterium]|nr:MAG: aspartate aminotransferase family protein [Ignavibacteriales bacterium]
MRREDIQVEPGLYSPLNTEAEIKSNLLQNYSRYPVEFVKGEGVWLYDKDDKKYLDFLSGIAVTGFGHNNPEIINAAIEQIKKLWHVSNLFEAGGQEKLAKILTQKSKLDYVFFCNSGTEANEAAIKFARKWGKERTHIICASNSFHGRTMGSLSATGQPKLWEDFAPLTPGFSFTDFGDVEELAHTYLEHANDTVAVMIEPIQGESGVIVPPDGYLKKVRNFCDEHNLLLIVDEVQTGMGRTGKFFCHQWEEIKPDIITVAKGIANGLPLGATICTKAVGNEIKPGNHGSTFGGNPVSIASALAVANLIDENILQNNVTLGKTLIIALEALHTDKIKAVRGKGLMIGVEFVQGVSAKNICKQLLKKGIVTGTSGDTVLRLLPPFIITEKEIVQFASTFDGVLNSL